MATITPVIIGKSINKVVMKFVGTATTDTATVPMSTALTITATATNVTFTAAAGTIVRATGSFISDGVTVGSVLVIAGTTNNNGTYIVKSVDSATQLTIERDTSVARNYLVDEVDATVTWTGSYKSDLLSYGQIIQGTPTINLARVRFAVAATGDATVVRNAVTILKLFGTHDFDCPTSEQNTQPITVTFTGTAGGTVILEMMKVAGFSAINPAGSY